MSQEGKGRRAQRGKGSSGGIPVLMELNLGRIEGMITLRLLMAKTSVMDHSLETGDGSGLVGKGLKGADYSSVCGVAISDQMSWGQDIDQREGQVHEEHVEPDALSKTAASSWCVCIFIKACVYSANGLLYLTHILRMMTPSCTSLILHVTCFLADVTTPSNKPCLNPNSWHIHHSTCPNQTWGRYLPCCGYAICCA